MAEVTALLCPSVKLDLATSVALLWIMLPYRLASARTCGVRVTESGDGACTRQKFIAISITIMLYIIFILLSLSLVTTGAPWILQPVTMHGNINNATPYAERARTMKPSALALRVAFGNSLLNPW
jgi:hypothetical protein